MLDRSALARPAGVSQAPNREAGHGIRLSAARLGKVIEEPQTKRRRETRARPPAAAPGAGVARSIPPSHRLRALRGAMLLDFEPELILACRVAVLATAGHRDAGIRRQLDCAPRDFVHAKERLLKRAAPRLDSVGPEELG